MITSSSFEAISVVFRVYVPYLGASALIRLLRRLKRLRWPRAGENVPRWLVYPGSALYVSVSSAVDRQESRLRGLAKPQAFMIRDLHVSLITSNLHSSIKFDGKCTSVVLNTHDEQRKGAPNYMVLLELTTSKYYLTDASQDN